MRQATRAARAVTVALALLAVALPMAGTPSAGAAAADLTPTGQRAFSELAGCVAAGRPLFAQFVVDESQSLETTDPGAARRVALLTAIDALADLDRQRAGTVHASLATFAKGYVPRVGWGRLDARHLSALRSFADQEIPRLHRGVATDYTEALTQAAASLRRAVGTRDACQALVFFTDGGLDVGRGATANKDALTRLCQPNGIADALRRQGVHLLAFGLLPKDGSGADSSERDRERLQAMAEGRGGGFSCGTVPVGPSRAGGAYLPAERAARLRALFESAVARISGFTPDVDVVCPTGTCRGGRLRIPIDPGIAVVRLVVVPEGRVDLSLIAPSGHSLGLPESEGIRRILDGTGVTTRSTSSTVRVDLDLPPEAPRGDWTLAVRTGAEPGRALVQVYRGGGLMLRLTPAGLTATAGETTRYSVRVVDRAGTVADPARWQTFALTAGAGSGSRQPLTRTGDAWSGTLDVPRTGFPLSLPLTLTLDLVTKPNLLRLAPVTLQTTVVVEPPASLPSVGPARLALPDVVGAGDTRGTLQLRGSDQGPTEVCLGQPRLHGPPQAGEFAVSTTRRCVALARDERASVTFTVDPSGKADGVVEGALPVALRGSRPGERAQLDVPVQFGMRRPVDEATRWELVALLVVVGMLVPLLVLWAAGRRAARLRFDVFTVADIPVLVTENGLHRVGEDGPLRLLPEDFRHQPPPDDRRCALATGVELRAGTPARTFFAPERVVEATDGRLIAGQHDERPAHRRRMRIPLGEPAAWVVICDDTPAAPRGEDGQLPTRLVAYRTKDGPESLSLLQQSLDGFGRWDRVVGDLRRRAPREAAAATSSAHGQPVPDHDPPPDFL